MATVTVVSVSASGFRRCGIPFTKEPTTLVEGTDITSAQLNILRGEKMLIVKEIAAAKTPPPPPPTKESKAAK